MGLFDIFKKKKQSKEVDIDLLQVKMYQSIFDKIQKWLPRGWKKVDFHTYYSRGYIGIKYYVMNEKSVWIECFKLLDEKIRKEMFSVIGDDIANVWKQLPEKHKWHVLNMIVDNQGHINVSYDYADAVNGDAEALFAYLLNEEKEWDKKFVDTDGIQDIII